VGESGCGKSTLALSLIGLLPKGESRISSGEISIDDKNVTRLSNKEIAKRGRKRKAMTILMMRIQEGEAGEVLISHFDA